jgi:hypothetical protein
MCRGPATVGMCLLAWASWRLANRPENMSINGGLRTGNPSCARYFMSPVPRRVTLSQVPAGVWPGCCPENQSEAFS